VEGIFHSTKRLKTLCEMLKICLWIGGKRFARQNLFTGI